MAAGRGDAPYSNALMHDACMHSRKSGCVGAALAAPTHGTDFLSGAESVGRIENMVNPFREIPQMQAGHGVARALGTTIDHAL